MDCEELRSDTFCNTTCRDSSATWSTGVIRDTVVKASWGRDVEVVRIALRNNDLQILKIFHEMVSNCTRIMAFFVAMHESVISRMNTYVVSMTYIDTGRTCMFRSMIT